VAFVKGKGNGEIEIRTTTILTPLGTFSSIFQKLYREKAELTSHRLTPIVLVEKEMNDLLPEKS
jgi:hypothetical protein